MTAKKPSEVDEFVSLYDLLKSIETHLRSIEVSARVIRASVEDTNARIRERERQRVIERAEVPKTP